MLLSESELNRESEVSQYIGKRKSCDRTSKVVINSQEHLEGKKEKNDGSESGEILCCQS